MRFPAPEGALHAMNGSAAQNPESEGGTHGSYPLSWHAVADRRFDGASLLAVLADYAHQLDEGTFVSELGKVLERERRMERQMAILLEAMTEVPQTIRVDGIMPFHILVPANVLEPVERLLKEVRRMHYAIPESGPELSMLRDEVAVCLLACLHGREVQVDHRLTMRLQLECPFSPNIGRKNLLMLMGYLPFGGRVTLFYSSLQAEDWLAMDAAEVEHEEALCAQRENGNLRVVATGNARPRAASERGKLL